MSWQVVIPLKRAGDRKQRLAPHFSPAARHALSEALFDHVVDTVARVGRIGGVHVLSPGAPTRPSLGWLCDGGRGLNPELAAACVLLAPADILILHADLPLLAPADLEALIDAGVRHGCAIAPDRHGAGTNAIALTAGRTLPFRFGPGSLRRHLAAADGRAERVERPGLALDCDTPDDIAVAARSGFRWPIAADTHRAA
ncbi:2-phospho-L-lactate guanylyltransferase [Sphingomonas naphthae]|uniref:3-phospho-D-glycerate guanylyltransferase n=1 Tax=Sphingomonas naphthae TaxID=1813468 RepID=A0ABY7TJW7_9SPHN|nr:2-phospho-L-lactate guanylyltransferase [Sphingomonas naphthae]WCT73505.1 2-phospho-L-lactate guanylyltransferase [Sphingomonas naphthae]